MLWELSNSQRPCRLVVKDNKSRNNASNFKRFNTLGTVYFDGDWAVFVFVSPWVGGVVEGGTALSSVVIPVISVAAPEIAGIGDVVAVVLPLVAGDLLWLSLVSFISEKCNWLDNNFSWSFTIEIPPMALKIRWIVLGYKMFLRPSFNSLDNLSCDDLELLLEPRLEEDLPCEVPWLLWGVRLPREELWSVSRRLLVPSLEETLFEVRVVVVADFWADAFVGVVVFIWKGTWDCSEPGSCFGLLMFWGHCSFYRQLTRGGVQRVVQRFDAHVMV